MSSERTRVLLGGWYGAANLGDELLLAAFAEWVREAGGEPVAISVNPHYTRWAHGIDAVAYEDLPALCEAMAAADLFVLGGGGLFQDYDVVDRASMSRFPALNVAQFAQFASLAREFAVPYAALAQGVGPLRAEEGRGIAREVFDAAFVASVRDESSANLLRTIGVKREAPVAPDPGWVLRAPPVVPATRFPTLAGRPVLALVVRDWPFDPHWEAAFVAAFRAAVPASWGCLWLDFTRTPDATGERPLHIELAPRVVPHLPGPVHVVWEGVRVQEAASLIAGSDALLAMRLHGVLLGHAHGVPTIALEYDDKVRALGDDLGLPASQRMPLPDIATRLPATLRRLTADRASFARVSPARRESLAQAALRHRDILQEAMACRRAAPVPEATYLSRWVAALGGGEQARVVDALLARLRRLTHRCA